MLGGHSRQTGKPVQRPWGRDMSGVFKEQWEACAGDEGREGPGQVVRDLVGYGEECLFLFGFCS